MAKINESHYMLTDSQRKLARLTDDTTGLPTLKARKHAVIIVNTCATWIKKLLKKINV